MFIFRKLLKFINWYSQVVHDMAAQQGPDTPLWMQWNEPDLKEFDNNVRELKARIRRTEGFFRLLKWKALRVYRHWVRFRVATIRLYRLSYSYVLNIFISLKTILLSIGWRVLVYAVESLFKIFYRLVDQPAHFLYKNFLKYYVDKYYYSFFHPYLVRWYYRVKIRLYKMWYSDFVTRVILFIYKVYIYAGVPTVEYLDEELELWTPEHKYYLHYRAEEALDMVIQSLDPGSDKIVEDYYEDIMEDVDADEYEFLSPWWYTSTFDSIFWYFLPGLLLFTNISLFEDRNHFFLTIDDLYFGHASNPLFTSDDIWKVRVLFTINAATFEAIDSKMWLLDTRKALSKFFGVNENSKFFNRIQSDFYKARKVKRPKPYFFCPEVFYGGWRDHTVALPDMKRMWKEQAELYWWRAHIEFYFCRVRGFYYYEILSYALLWTRYFRAAASSAVAAEWIRSESVLWAKVITCLVLDNTSYRGSTIQSKRMGLLELIGNLMSRRAGRKTKKRWLELASDVDYDVRFDGQFLVNIRRATQNLLVFHRAFDVRPGRKFAKNYFWKSPPHALTGQLQALFWMAYEETQKRKWGKITWAIAVDKYVALWGFWADDLGWHDENLWWYNEPLLRRFLYTGYKIGVLAYWEYLEKNSLDKNWKYKADDQTERRVAKMLKIKCPEFSPVHWKAFIDQPGYKVRNTIDMSRRFPISATLWDDLRRYDYRWNRW